MAEPPLTPIEVLAPFAALTPIAIVMPAAKKSQSQTMDHIAGNRMNMGFRKDIAVCVRGNIGFAPAHITGAIENAAREIGSLNRIKINHDYVGKTEQGEIFQDLIAQRSSANHQHARRAQLFLVPPADEPKAANPVIIGGSRAGRQCHGVVHRAPAVISG